MNAARIWAAGALVFALAGAARADCAGDVDEAERRVVRLAGAMDQAGALRRVGEAALDGLSACPDDERLWMLAARSAEILEGRVGAPPFSQRDARSLAAEAFAHFPRSATLATIDARLAGGLGAAQRAYQLDPAYAPARRLYALRLAEASRVVEALPLLAGAARAERLARAQALLAARRYPEAEAAARAAKTAPPGNDPELTPDTLAQSDAAEALAFALIGEGRNREAQAPLREAAALGSRRAVQSLAGTRNSN